MFRTIATRSTDRNRCCVAAPLLAACCVALVAVLGAWLVAHRSAGAGGPASAAPTADTGEAPQHHADASVPPRDGFKY
jgi:hypothetical protein